MTPAARVAAAIEVLDEWLGGMPAERALSNWGRRSRYAGAKDRAALRDLVYDALRCRRSLAALGGAETGRGLMIGAARAAGISPEQWFTGEGHAPPPLTEAEASDPPADLPDPVRLDCPDWLWPRLGESLGEAGRAQMLREGQARAPIFLRVNTARASRTDVIARLAAEEIGARPHPEVETALEVTDNPRRIARSALLEAGEIEVQDAASQAVVAALPLPLGARVLDYCAGAGGKALALAARGAKVTAHDVAPARMADLPKRATRAGVHIPLSTTAALRGQSFDLVFCDAPCSGSGTWRRDPEAKWRLTPDALAELVRTQAEVLDAAAPLVAPAGSLAYVTCSVLAEEDEMQVAAFLARHPGWTCAETRRWPVGPFGDGFYLALLLHPDHP
ncbi:MAG: RsmB/NOP family class I SAM-dependent RNA methyltransferase [Limimaricola sp.]|uniref:RsmB/NOP family class I SAM-dependent RNA methyltransferase n=1 Tax=Limimaricola sp. TaxID=2211665 RepID=UPI001DA7A928|nr:RsmB/NOP family class I SAM-dependent RNA methyltransferase [Limimaricola sp.]MBI1418261.1 RsmB/NOP family class I SAM-dependent RNA methyltransferase [Limimaricola sp.]